MASPISSVVLHLSALLAGSVLVKAAGVSMAARTSPDALVTRMCGGTDIRGIITCWRALLMSMTELQKADVELQRPGVLSRTERTLQRLEMHLRLLECEDTTLWQRIWPSTKSAKDVDPLLDELDQAAASIKTAMMGLPQTNPVAAVLALTNAAPDALNDGDTTEQISDLVTVPNAAAPLASDDSDTQADLAMPDVSPEVMTAYQSVVATTAALLSPLLASQGGQHAESQNMSPP